jgi:flagellar hook-associated protein 2
MVSGAGRITFGGLASGIDTNSIIDQLIQIQRRPITLAENRLLQVQSKSDAFGKIATALSALKTRADTINNVDTYRQRATTVLAKDADANKISAVATTSAAVGAYSLHVTQLATQTKATSATAVGEAVDAGVPLDEAGFGMPPTSGTFSINGTTFTIDPATATTVASAASVGVGFNPTAKLDSAGLDIAPVTGTFEINGVPVNFDPSADTLQDVMQYINASGAGVIASYDEGTETFTLTHETVGSGQTITLDDVAGNFLEAMKLIDSGGATIGVETAGTDMVSLTDVIDEINNAAIGVTASLELDGDGRLNLLQITSGSSVQLGSGGDTSNFLSATSLLQSPPGTTRTSQHGIGAVSRTDDLSSARLATALTETEGSFKVNGVEISFDASTDSLSNLITRVNNSDAGVTMTYDTYTDRLVVTNDESGALGVQFEDVQGNLLTALGLAGGSQTLGQSAAYSLNGEPTRYSTSNTITDAVDGVTFTVSDTTTEAVKINVAMQNNGAISSVDAFVSEFNKSLDLLAQMTAYSEDGNNGVLFGDGTVRRIEQGLRSMVTRSVSGIAGGLRTLSDIGISFGAVGAAAGSANRLVFDNAKFSQAMQENPDGVSQLLTVFTASASLTAGGTGSIASMSGTPTTATKTGRYTIESTALGVLQSTFTPDDGSSPVVKTGSITAGGTNTTLIPGVTLTGAGVLAAGTDEIVISASSQGFAKTLAEYVDSLTRTGGLLATRDEETTKIITDINAQIDRLEARVTAREEQLVKKFTAMELAISQMQSQQQALTQMQNQLAGLNGK